MVYKVYFRDIKGSLQHIKLDVVNLDNVLTDLKDQLACASHIATAIQQPITMPVLAVIK